MLVDFNLAHEIYLADKELDIIEMAAYGDVIRPGNQCRCRTVAEMLGKVKLKNPLAACELPYKENQWYAIMNASSIWYPLISLQYNETFVWWTAIPNLKKKKTMV